MELYSHYHGDVADGTQWVFWLTQGESEKSIYFNNNFPSEIEQFATSLDAILDEAGVEDVAWRAVPEAEWRDHEDSLWQSIRQTARATGKKFGG